MVNLELYYDEPRLKMSVFSRFLIRFFSYSTYGILAATAVTLSLSDIKGLQSAGWLLDLFLLDRVIHLGKSERSLARLPRRGKFNAALAMAPSTFSIIEWAFERALILGGDFILYAVRKLIDRKEIREGLRRMDAKPEEILVKLDDYIKNSQTKTNTRAELLREAERLVLAAFSQALAAKSGFIEPKDLFAALKEVKNENLAKLFKLFDIDAADLESALIFGRAARKLWWLKRLPSTLTGFVGRPYKIRHRIMNRAWTARPTPLLDKFSDDLTDLARTEKVGFLIGHQIEYDRLADILSRPGNPNALLVGDPGIGKETVIAHLAFQIVKDRVPPALFDKRLVKLDLGALVAGAGEGELQERIKKIIDEIIMAGNIILYIPDIHNLLKTSGQLRMSAADIFLPVIKSDVLSVIGAAYPREFKEYIEPNSDFLSSFEVIRVQEISESEAVRFLVYDSIILERRYKMMITFGAVKEAARLAHKYFRDKLLPSSAKDLLTESLADAAEKGNKILTPEYIIATAERRINIPIHKAGQAEAEQLLNLEDLIHQRLIDQEEAVKEVAQALREYRSGLSRKGGPIAAFLFVGPTGVGKTELSKILAKIQFGSAETMIRFDMSEYQDKSTVNRLLDNVTGAVREKPYSLILLDEFEKAHPDILNLFLQVFDDGRLTDSLGRVVDFQNTIIIATSNAHSDFIKSQIEQGVPMKQVAEELKKKLTEYFRPELLNRFSDIIVFKSLSPADIEAIAGIQLADLANQVREARGIDLTFDESAVKKVAELGYDPVFGARPLRNVISDKIKAALAEKILRGEIARGATARVYFSNDKFVYS
jgi:ATP-dependent Clp protease ATP-binding subunit ClpC